MTEGPTILKASVSGVTFGADVTLVEPVNLDDCFIGDNSFIGPFVEIQRAVTVGRRCRIQSHAFICELVTIGDDCFISHGAKFVNDLFKIGGPARGDRSLFEKTDIGNRASIGTNATVLPVRITEDVVVGAGAVVTRDLLVRRTYGGNQARLIRQLPSDPTVDEDA